VENIAALDCVEKVVVKLYMKEYIWKMLQEFKYANELKDIKKASNPAADYLFV